MIEVNGIKLNFDITSPADVMRYRQAGERMEQNGAEISLPKVTSGTSEFFDAYIAMLNAELQIYGDFLDAAFGDGTAALLLGDNPSLNTITDINDALAAAMKAQGDGFGARLQKYTPNRATRRARQ